jgi:Protein of unknown function (DUF3386)
MRSLLLTLALTGAAAAASAQPINLQEYYPTGEGDSWTYQFHTYQTDGQVNYATKTFTIKGELEMPDGTKAKRLIDQKGWYYILRIEADKYLHYGEEEDKGLITNDPPFEFYNARNAFGKLYQNVHKISDGTARGTEVVFDGYESVSTPAGEFKDCLKSTFKYINPGGSTFTSITWLAKGVGPVKKEFMIYSPKAGQTLRFDRELISAKIAGKQVGGAVMANIGDYFPFFQADEWTYEWSYTMADGAKRTEDRTRSFAGTDFAGRTAAYKLIDNKGSYQLYTYDPNEGIQMHSSFENRAGGQILSYQPAVAIVRPNQVFGKDYQWSEPMVDQPEGVTERTRRLQKWTSRVDGFETLETSMGTFEVLKTTLSWETTKSLSTQTYYFAKGVGIVGLDYSHVDSITGKRGIALNARLKKAKLQGDLIQKVADVEPHLASRAARKTAELADDPEARAIFRAASENRYIWDNGFPGLTADLEIVNLGKPMVIAKVSVDKNLVLDFECDKCDGQLRSEAKAYMSQFITHRAPEPFDEKYGVGKAGFKMVNKKRPDGMVEVRVDGDTAMGSWYLLDPKKKEVKKLTRKLGGPIEFMINQERNIRTEDGRYIANYYPVEFFMMMGEKKIPLGTMVYDDLFQKNGKWWMPVHRTVKGEMPNMDRTVSKVDIEMRFKNVKYMGPATASAGGNQ